MMMRFVDPTTKKIVSFFLDEIRQVGELGWGACSTRERILGKIYLDAYGKFFLNAVDDFTALPLIEAIKSDNLYKDLKGNKITKTEFKDAVDLMTKQRIKILKSKYENDDDVEQEDEYQLLLIFRKAVTHHISMLKKAKMDLKIKERMRGFMMFND